MNVTVNGATPVYCWRSAAFTSRPARKPTTARRKPSIAHQVAGPLWSLVHGIASLAIDGELHNVGIDQDPEDMVARALSGAIKAP